MAIPSRQIGGSTRTNLLWQISKQLEELICVRSGGCGQITTTTTSTFSPGSILGCVYNNNIDAIGNPLELYDVSTNTSTPVVIPTGNEFTSFAETHTQNKYWKGNQTSLIREWVSTSVPNVLEINRNITVTGIISPFGNYFTFLEAVDDNHLLTIVYNAPLFTNILTLLDITSGSVTASEITPLFDIYAPNGLDSFILTTTNKIIAIGRRDVGPATNLYFLTQYSYPDGALELELNISSTLTYAGTTRPQLFQSGDGNIYIFAGNNIPGNEFSTIFEIDLNSPYTITPIWSNLGLYLSLFNSSVNCNTVNLNPCCALSDVTIETQTWTGCNLDVTNYQNGDPIPQVQDPVEWADLTTGAWCYYDNDPTNGCTYGKLYNWYAVNDPRGLAPTGYHVPTDAECTTLVNYLGGLPVAGGPLKEAGTVHWASPNVGATNSTGFTFLPGGLRNAYVGDFTYISFGGGFWTTTSGTDPLTARNLGFDYNNDDAYGGDFRKEVGFSVRLIEDNLCSVGDVTIGTQTWTGCNLNVSYYRNGDVIPQVSDPTAWAGLNTGAWCWYNNDASNGATYGKLYNWYAVNDPRGLAPTGYHIPTVAEYNILQIELGGISSGGPLKEAGFAHWIAPNTGATNTSGWTGLPGGQRSFNSVYQYIGEGAAFWTSSSVDPLNATALQLYFTNDNFVEFPSLQTVGFSIRLIKDPPATTTTTTTQEPSGFNTIYTHFEALTITTTTTLAPSGFNTIYTHFESL